MRQEGGGYMSNAVNCLQWERNKGLKLKSEGMSFFLARFHLSYQRWLGLFLYTDKKESRAIIYASALFLSRHVPFQATSDGDQAIIGAAGSFPLARSLSSSPHWCWWLVPKRLVPSVMARAHAMRQQAQRHHNAIAAFPLLCSLRFGLFPFIYSIYEIRVVSWVLLATVVTGVQSLLKS